MNHYAQKLLGKCNALYSKEKNSEFYLMNSKIKIKINNNKDDLTIGHELDLIKKFGEATMQAIEVERAAHNNN